MMMMMMGECMYRYANKGNLGHAKQGPTRINVICYNLGTHLNPESYSKPSHVIQATSLERPALRCRVDRTNLRVAASAPSFLL